MLMDLHPDEEERSKGINEALAQHSHETYSRHYQTYLPANGQSPSVEFHLNSRRITGLNTARRVLTRPNRMASSPGRENGVSIADSGQPTQ